MEIPKFAVIGDPINHSLSPQIHQAFAKTLGIQLQYERIRADVTAFEQAVAAFRQSGGIGLNVTSPCKREAYRVIKHCDGILGLEAELSKSVNTLSWKLREGQWVLRGDNTDGIGFQRDLTKNLAFHLKNTRILILGAGGSAQGIIPVLLAANPLDLVVYGRNSQRLAALLAQFQDIPGASKLQSFDLVNREKRTSPFDLIVDTWQIPSEAAWTYPAIPSTPRTLAYELRYTPHSLFCQWAVQKGLQRFSNGLGMLVEQAAESFRCWHGVLPETQPVLSRIMLAGQS